LVVLCALVQGGKKKRKNERKETEEGRGRKRKSKKEEEDGVDWMDLNRKKGKLVK
jgi:hypothetical protein